jgi:acetolactate decarboxylase
MEEKMALNIRWFGLILAAAFLTCGCAVDRDTVYQVSTFSALQERVFDGEVTIGELRKHGNLGIGTFDALDGEMILLGGEVYRFGADGIVTRVPDDWRTPFAAVTPFEPDQTLPLASGTDLEAFKSGIDKLLPTLNLPYAARITGNFAWVKTRAPRRQSRPYPRLVDALADQPEFEYRETRGTMVGFRLPAFVNGVNVPGWHLHFLSDDRTRGGHVLGFTVGTAKLELDQSPNLRVVLPVTGDFAATDLSRDVSHEVDRIEGGSVGGHR